MVATGFDYIIVGAGSAGCVLADRLSKNPLNRVLLLEAGGRDVNPLIRMPKGFGKLLDHPDLAWHFPVQPIGPSGRMEQWHRGRTLGGSSAINGMVYNRGSQPDYDELVTLGNPGWGWDTILPIFRTMENHQLGASAVRGSDGPLDISVDTELPGLCTEYMASATVLGMSSTTDINSTDDQRIGPAARTIKNGRRVSSADAFLRSAQRRPNLTVAVDTAVHRVIFEGDKAVGVKAESKKLAHCEYFAEREVVLSLGSIATPKLLQLSGIGDSALLRSVGVDPIVESPNVGRRMLEHRCFSVQFGLKEDIGYNKMLSSPVRQAWTGLKYLVNHKGPLSTSAYDVVGFFKTSADALRPDAQLLMAPMSTEPLVPGKPATVDRRPGIGAMGYILRPDSEGSVEITSADPHAPLAIEPNFFATEHDRRTGAAIFRTLRQIFEQSPVADQLTEEIRPGAVVVSDEEIVNAALEQGYCGYHAVGTCAMGPDDDDVVDSELRVRGVHNLRVMDASVMPTMISGNLNGPVMAMAWHAADLILGD